MGGYKLKPTVLLKEKFNFDNVYNNKYYIAKYIYEVELLILNDFRGKKSVVNTHDFQNLLIEEHGKEEKKKYDLDINIRDLYPIEIHYTNKSSEDIERFNKINEIMLQINDRISRRVTKKEIVYKKDKSKSILSIQISKRKYLKIFFLPAVEDFDYESKFTIISRSNRKPLERLFKIKSEEDFKYMVPIIKKYIKKVLSKWKCFFGGGKNVCI